MNPDEYWYPHYPARFRRKTMHLTAAQRGVYRDLLDHYYESREPLPDNDIALARIGGVTIDEFSAMSATIRAFFFSENGYLYQETCEEELETQGKKAKKRTKIGQNAAKKRWSQVRENKEKNASSMHEAYVQHAGSNANAMHKHATGQDRTGHKDSIVGKRTIPPSTQKQGALALPDDFQKFWDGWRPYDMPKGSKQDAIRNYHKARKDADHETLIRKRDEYLTFCHATQCKTKHAAVWLSKRGWEDDIPEPSGARQGTNSGNPDSGGSERHRVDATKRVIDNLIPDEID